MPYVKGMSGNPTGRPKGSRNRSTIVMREVVAQLVDDNLDNMSDWLHRIGQDDPKAAFQCMLGLMEFNMPKMSRSAYIEEKEEAPGASKEFVDALLKDCFEAIEREKLRTAT